MTRHAERKIDKKGPRAAGGFTLVELMVVVAIIAILAGIGVPKLTAFIRASEAAEATQQMGRMAKALEGWASTHTTADDANSVTSAPRLDPDLSTGYSAGSDIRNVVPYMTIDPDGAFDYYISNFGAAASEICIQAIAHTGGYNVYYSKTEVGTGGWDTHFYTNDYINETTDTHAAATSDCSAATAQTAF